jgi:single-stranded DNA-binding protein
MNKIIITGFLNKKYLSTAYTSSGKPLCEFVIADSIKTITGEKKYQYFDCVSLNEQVFEFVNNAADGALIELTGRMIINKSEKSNGEKRKYYKIFVNEINFLLKKENSNNISNYTSVSNIDF